MIYGVLLLYMVSLISIKQSWETFDDINDAQGVNKWQMDNICKTLMDLQFTAL